MPYERCLELKNDTPPRPDITLKYWEKQEIIRPRHYQYLCLIKETKMSQMS